MALESVTHIDDLDPENPAALDRKSQGDDHIRNIKTALINCFPGFTGGIIAGGTDTGFADAYILSAALTA